MHARQEAWHKTQLDASLALEMMFTVSFIIIK